MDRAHRLGQTKQVTVYRLITKGTIDERIVKLARNKKEVQDIVVGNKAYSETGMARPQEIVSLLLDDDELAESMLRRKQAEEQELLQVKADNARASQAKRKLNRAAAAAAEEDARRTAAVAWQLEDDEDDFFGAKPPSRPEESAAPSPAAATQSKPLKKRKSNAIEGDGDSPKKSQKRAKTDANGASEIGAGTTPNRKTPAKRSHKKKTAEELAGAEAALLDEE
jgi:chromatin-remodeling ATPase INO80